MAEVEERPFIPSNENMPTDPWARRMREALEGTRTFDTGGAENQRAQMEAIHQNMETGQTFAQAVSQAPVQDGPIDTRAEVMAVRDALQVELGKPSDQQDMDFIKRATSVLTAFGEQTGGVGADEAEQGAQVGFQGQPVQARRGPPVQGMPTEISPEDQLSSRAAGQSAKQRLEDIGNFFKRPFLSDEEKQQKASELRIERAQEQLQLEADARASGVDPAALSAPQFVGGMLPDVAIGSAAGLPIFSRTLAGAAARVATETGIGATLGGSSVPLDEDPLHAAVLDGGITLGLGTFSELPGLGMDFLRRELRAARNSDRNTRLQEISDNAGIDLTLGERTQTPAVLQAERSVPSRPAGPREEFLRKRQAQVEGAFIRTIDKLNPARLSQEEIITGTRQAYDKAITGKRKMASEQFRKDISDAAEKLGAKIDDEGRIRGGLKFLKPDNLIDELIQQRQILADQPLTGTSKAALTQLDREIQHLQSGRMDLGQLQRMLKDLAQQNKPSGIVIKDNTQAVDILNSGAVQRALNKDIDAHIADETLPEEFGDALLTLQDARQNFGTAMADIDVFKGKAVDNLLGKLGDPESPQFAQRILAMPGKSFEQMVDLADDADPALGNAIRAAVFEELLDKHRRFDLRTSEAGAARGKLETDKVFEEIIKMPMSKLMAFTGSNLPAKDIAQMRNTLITLQAIAEGPSGSAIQARALRERAEQWAINAASRDVGFVSRLLTGEISPGFIERMLFTRNGQDALSTLAQPNVAKANIAQAFTYLSNAMREDEEQTAEIQRQRLNQRVGESGAF